jgi:hypothetical protein
VQVKIFQVKIFKDKHTLGRATADRLLRLFITPWEYRAMGALWWPLELRSLSF